MNFFRISEPGSFLLRLRFGSCNHKKQEKIKFAFHFSCRTQDEKMFGSGNREKHPGSATLDTSLKRKDVEASGVGGKTRNYAYFPLNNIVMWYMNETADHCVYIRYTDVSIPVFFLQDCVVAGSAEPRNVVVKIIRDVEGGGGGGSADRQPEGPTLLTWHHIKQEGERSGRFFLKKTGSGSGFGSDIT
jgi:hypothetical protein